MVFGPKRAYVTVAGVALIALGGVLLSQEELFAQGRDLSNPAVPITLSDVFAMPAADAQTQAVVEAADAFLATLSDDQRLAVIFPFDDNAQRANWSNFPDAAFQRAGLSRGEMTEAQLTALDALLAQVLSEDGLANARYQMRADDISAELEPDGPNFGADNYYVSFIGEPSATAPFMVQFGGHHLAYNATFFGADASFSPMLTGGEPLRIDYEGAAVTIAEQEALAATAFLESLDATQRAAAVRGDNSINLLLGPGAYGVTVAPEGVKGSDLSDDQKALLEDVIASRLGYVNADDFAALMEQVRAGMDDTTFGWWGPAEPLGGAYWRVTGPTLVIEYAPQDMDGDATNHAHNMYRDPTNDYGAAWIAE